MRIAGNIVFTVLLDIAAHLADGAVAISFGFFGPVYIGDEIGFHRAGLNDKGVDAKARHFLRHGFGKAFEAEFVLHH